MTERWLPVPGYEGAYEVSDLGRVRSLDRVVQQGTRWGGVMDRRMDGRVLRPGTGRAGELFVSLQLGGDIKLRRIHALVLEAFTGPCPDGMEVCHNNGRNTDNTWTNLRYDTHANNCADKIAHGTHNKGEKHNQAKLVEADAVAIRLDNRSSETIAHAFGISAGHVEQIRQRMYWPHV